MPRDTCQPRRLLQPVAAATFRGAFKRVSCTKTQSGLESSCPPEGGPSISQSSTVSAVLQRL
eukprot:1438974-Pyramimonas_sp.AAC.1